MMELKSVAEMDIEQMKKEFFAKAKERNVSVTEDTFLHFEIMHQLMKEHYERWLGMYQGIQTQSYQFFPDAFDMEHGIGKFSTPKAYDEYKNKVVQLREKAASINPQSDDVRRYDDMLKLFDAMQKKDGVIFGIGVQNMTHLNRSAYTSRYSQLNYANKRNRVKEKALSQKVTDFFEKYS